MRRLAFAILLAGCATSEPTPRRPAPTPTAESTESVSEDESTLPLEAITPEGEVDTYDYVDA